MILIFMVGLVLLFLSWNIDYTLEQTDCKSSLLKTSNKLVLCISVAMIVSSLSFFTCVVKTEKSFGSSTLGSYISIMFILGIVLIILGSIISSESVGQCESTENSSSILGTGLVIVVICLLYFFAKFQKIKKN